MITAFNGNYKHKDFIVGKELYSKEMEEVVSGSKYF
jgi:hypothetical protein